MEMPCFATSPIFQGDNIIQATFTRRGGASVGIFSSLNVSYGVGDDAGAVSENRRRIKEALGIKYLFSARQVHGDRLAVVRDHPGMDVELDGCDALVTTLPGVGLMVQQADCQAVMLHDPARRVVANIHAGWRGSARDIVGKTVRRMVGEFGCRPVDIRAAISPSLGPCCAEFMGYEDVLPEAFHGFQSRENYFDFWAITRTQLCDAGIQAEHVETAGRCTVCDPEYFSYRREKNTGRFGSVIAIGSK